MSNAISLAVCVSPFHVAEMAFPPPPAEGDQQTVARSDDIFRVTNDIDGWVAVPAANDDRLPVPHMYSA